ncbi:MAG: iron-sulfur cluster-binding protein [Chloroflexi bacterium]|jgi:L-lactate dehydrogenase complex protein LldF|nr:iron-sulfur cluster-binding protein [Chloroflexota bacterium]MBT5252133.1 iron-sulfur cluster-binding protein [Chloroflexota bacterium]MBT5893007.1 iron-sulfur cluster-binding protein [Chloroflexota bacterium]MBT7004401.1 iron-sulfur cluster-binding protein [Chloroflexota bacterium]MBT7467310.1 iron-sulfur cluster-binding protein [Chloroflexota bacterium]
MKPLTVNFRSKAALTLADAQIQQSIEHVYTGFFKGRLTAAGETPDWENLRTKGKAIKDHTIAHLDYYLGLLTDNVEKNGGSVFFADDAEEARQHILDLAHKLKIKTVIKSKSMVSEEMGLAEAMTDEGFETVETDLGEYIIQLANETPYHLIAPAVHKSRADVARLLDDDYKDGDRVPDATELTMMAREKLRGVFERADMSVTGVNFAVAESGSIALVTNEGNGRMSTTVPRVHVAVMGMEKIVPSIQDLSTMLRILIRSATGQRISTYVTMVNGKRKPDEEEGPEEFHLVIMNNGRQKLLEDPQLRESLNCIRCGACLNACPVYRKVGGHAYGWVYPGPIGAIVTPVLTGLKDADNLPSASSLCGACHDACPVKINIPRMLLELRYRTAEGSTDKVERTSSAKERGIWKAWRMGMMGRKRFDIGSRIASIALKPLSRNGWLKKAPPPLSGWTSTRDFPVIAASSLKSRLKKRSGDLK